VKEEKQKSGLNFTQYFIDFIIIYRVVDDGRNPKYENNYTEGLWRNTPGWINFQMAQSGNVKTMI